MLAVYLTGFMGSGKTTIGKELGKYLGVPVIDTDEWIEKEKDKSIRDIFNEEGEESFRKYERECLKEMPEKNAIITTGGGMIIQSVNRQYMQTHGQVIYLHCDLDEIFRRLEKDTSRPLLDGTKRENIRKLMNERKQWYEESHIKIDTTQRSINDIVKEIADRIKLR
ncbi:shikimate kinase [Bacillus solimangrovi]|uniref:Shikimate kinase n=1 Tax=Bacillus solimangrovi TaxID=1305675 RepID=A0A1E5LFN9_9BACI|nr:shikimate kinase [Bacillus solimangrovi]OEH92880.1 shikimate kinase [Bacillus solimangrovi]